MTLTFELGRDFCTVHLTAKFDRPTFSRSEVIVRTNKQTNKLTNKNRRRWKHPPRSAMLCRWVSSYTIYRMRILVSVTHHYSRTQTTSGNHTTITRWHVLIDTAH